MERPKDPARRDPDLQRLADASADLLGAGDDLARALGRWTSEVAVDDAARRRARERWLRLQAAEEASVAGTLVDLAERDRPVLVRAGALQVRGAVLGLGADFVALRSDQGQQVVVLVDAVDTFHSEPGAGPVTGARTALVDMTAADLLRELVADRPTVRLRTRGGAAVRGELRTAGVDVLLVRADGDPPTATWVPFASIASFVLHP